MFDAIENWLRVFLAQTPYVYQHGEFTEGPEDGGQFFCSITQTSSPGPSVEDRTKRFTVFLIGRAQTRGDAAKILSDAENISLATMGEIMPCGVARVSVTSEPIGPGFTTDNRPFCQIGIQINF